MKLRYEFDLAKTDPEIEMEIPYEDIQDMFLSIARRPDRNQSNLYQQKHINGTENSRERNKLLTDLNIPIESHFRENLQVKDVFSEEKRYLAVGVGDCSANLFRCSYDPLLWPDSPFFYLQQEPYKEKEYYGFILVKEQGKIKANIEKLTFPQEKPLINGKEIPGLLWLFCSVPLVFRGNIVDGAEMAKNNYDLRHLFGKERATPTINEIYKAFKHEGYLGFCRAIDANRDKIPLSGTDVEWYHAGIGIKGNELLVIHHIGSLMDLAGRFQRMGVDDAVLLDSGGSSFIWANWNYSGFLAHHWYFRPNRGAIIVFQLNGQRKLNI